MHVTSRYIESYIRCLTSRLSDHRTSVVDASTPARHLSLGRYFQYSRPLLNLLFSTLIARVYTRTNWFYPLLDGSSSSDTLEGPQAWVYEQAQGVSHVSSYLLSCSIEWDTDRAKLYLYLSIDPHVSLEGGERAAAKEMPQARLSPLQRCRVLWFLGCGELSMYLIGSE